MKEFVPEPWSAINVSDNNGKIIIKTWGREYEIDNSLFPVRMNSRGRELLRAPITVVGEENGKRLQISENKSWLLSNDEKNAVIVCSAKSESFVFNTSLSVDYDGFCKIDFKVMPTGYTVNQVFGVESNKDKDFNLEKLWVEIPLSEGVAENYHYWPTYWKEQSATFEENPIKYSNVSMSRKIPSSMSMGFKSLIYLGNNKVGLSYSAENDREWNYSEGKAIEFVKDGENVTLRIRFLDSQPKKWKEHAENPRFLKQYGFMPVTFTFALQATPVKPLDSCVYPEKSLHIDCFNKINGDYYEYLLTEKCGRYDCLLDKIKASGVSVLYLHEKWNIIQNFWEIAVSEKPKIKAIIDECHKRDIKVIPYFGYELSTLNPLWGELSEEVLQNVGGQYPNNGGWDREPRQRAYVVCYASKWKEIMLDGVKKMMEIYDFDGIYLDSMLYPTHCSAEKHGCGYRDDDGTLKVTYPVFSIRDFMKRLREIMGNKIIGAHSSNCLNVPSMGLCDVIWDGEAIQSFLHENGIEALPLDYMRAEYDFNGIGVYFEFLIYTFDNWNFIDGLSLALIHGMLPKPNSADEPLDVMKKIWAIYESFPLKKAKFCPYYDDSPVASSNKKVKASAYVTENEGALVIVSNPTKNAETTQLFFGRGKTVTDAFSGERIDPTSKIKFEKKQTRIFLSKTEQ